MSITRDDILGKIDQIEDEKGVRTLLAVESGSRCWGFASKDSDYDVRFVYVRPKDDYLRLEDVRDTIERRYGDDLDMAGWDLAKFLRLMRKSNPQTFEWMGSGITYVEDPRFKAVRNASKACFDPVAHAHHYMGMAIKHDIRYLREDKVTLKRYLYVVRAFLSARWSVDELSPAPMAFDRLVEAKLEPELRSIVDNLVAEKRIGNEDGHHELIPALDAWVASMREELSVRVAAMERPRKVDWRVLDDVFLGILDPE